MTTPHDPSEIGRQCEYDRWKLMSPEDEREMREQRYFDACDEDYDRLYDERKDEGKL